MSKDKDKNLLFAVLAVQLKGVAPEKVMEIASAWMINPSEPLAQRIQASGLLPPDDVAMLSSLVNEMIQACEGNVEVALNSVAGASKLTQSIIHAAERSPSSGQETKAMSGDINASLGEIVLSSLEELPGRYSHISEHGKGGMGRVLLVHDEFLGRNIALKELLLPHDSLTRGPGASPMRDTTGMLARFLLEARVTGQLEHPSIVPVYELGRRTNGTLYYTMKLVRGSTLAKALLECKNLRERLGLLHHVIDLCQALTYAHSRGVLHRDLKPANAMIGEFGETVLLDWGLAKLKGTEDILSQQMRESLTAMNIKPPSALPESQTGEAMGTPNYMPPEQARGEVDDLDERSDVYSMGAVLYEVLTGKPPFDGPSAEAVLLRVVSMDPVPIQDREPDAPRELISICNKAMAKSPDARYQSMRELRDELLRFQTGGFVRSYQYNPREVLSHHYQKHRNLVHAAAAFSIAMVLLGIFSYVSIWQARNREAAQRVAAEASRNDAVLARDETRAALDSALEQQYLAQLRLAQSYIDDHQMQLANDALESAPDSLRDWVWTYLHNEANPDVFTGRSRKSVISSALFEPGGRFIAAMRYPEAPALWDATTGDMLRELEGDAQRYNMARFNADGARFAAIGEGGILDVWETATGKRLMRTETAPMGYDVAFSPDGQRIWASYEDGLLKEWNIADGTELRTVQAEGRALGSLTVLSSGETLLGCDGELANAINLSDGSVAYALPAMGLYVSPDQRQLVAFTGASLSLHDAATGNLVHPLAGHTHDIMSVSFSADSRKLVTTGNDNTVRLWNLHDGTAQRIWRTGARSPVYAWLLADERRVAVATHDNWFQLLQLDADEPLLEFRGENPMLSLAELSPDRRRIVGAAAFHAFELFDPQYPTGLKAVWVGSPGALKNEIGQAQTNANVTRAAWLADDAIHTADLRNRAPLAQWPVPANTVNRLALAPDGEHVLYTQGNTVAVRDAAAGSALLTYQGHTAEVGALAAGPVGKLAASADADGNIHVWDRTTGVAAHTLKLDSPVHALAFLEQDQHLLAGCADGYVRRLNLASGEIVKEFAAQESEVVALAVASNRNVFACIARDGATAVWALDGEAPLAQFQTEEAFVAVNNPWAGVSFTPDEQFLVVRGGFFRPMIIDAESLAVKLRLPVGQTLSILPDGSTAVLITSKGVVRELDVSVGGNV